jgi:hypothetical protein
MNPISGDVAKEFCELCNWAYECWLTHKRLFDKNDHKERTLGKAEYFTARLSTITQEYSLLQICKLHDPAIQGGSLNITIDYIERFGEWGSDRDRIQGMLSKLRTLFEKIKSARNKVLAHNDLETLMHATTLGEFPQGLDEQYFSALQELVNEVHGKWCDGPYPFNDLAGADVDEFLNVLERA